MGVEMATRVMAFLWVFAFSPPQNVPYIEGVGDWNIIMVREPRTDQTALALTKSDAIVQLLRNGSPYMVTVRSHACVGRPLILRIDDKKALLLGEKGHRNVELATSQMLSGKKAILSYWPNPCKEPQTLELDLNGFAETLQKANELTDEDLQGLEAQILAEHEAARKAEAEHRLKEDPTSELLLAARNGNIVRVIQSLDLGADINTQSESNGYTPLIWASSRGHTETVRLLLEEGADVNVQANDGQTALMRAADYGHVEVVTLLSNSGADVNVQSKNGITALRLATLKGHTQIIQLLKKAGAKE
jgi:hypothetical protein